MPFEHIWVAIDGSTSSSHALDTAIELASLLGARLAALAVEGPLPAATLGEVDEVKREKDRFFQGLCADAIKRARGAGLDLDVRLRPGHAAELIARYAFEIRADLIVVGHKGHFARAPLLGSTADRVANHAQAPVLIVR